MILNTNNETQATSRIPYKLIVSDNAFMSDKQSAEFGYHNRTNEFWDPSSKLFLKAIQNKKFNSFNEESSSNLINFWNDDSILTKYGRTPNNLLYSNDDVEWKAFDPANKKIKFWPKKKCKKSKINKLSESDFNQNDTSTLSFSDLVRMNLSKLKRTSDEGSRRKSDSTNDSDMHSNDRLVTMGDINAF